MNKKSFIAIALFAVIGILTMNGKDNVSPMDRFVGDLMKKMTLEEKVGQLNLVSNWMYVTNATINEKDLSIQQIKRGQMGGVYGFTDMKQIRMIQGYAVDSTRLHIPLLFGNDVIHGFITTFPIPLAISTSWNMPLVEKSARMAAREATAVGIDWVFSPMVDICRDARWGRICEGGGEDPYLGGEIAKAYVRGYQGNDLSADTTAMVCVKHYAMYGAAEAGRDYNSVFLSRQEAFNGYLNPYMQAAKAGAGSYMSSFNEFEGIPMTCNKYMLTDVLRGMWGFDGFVASDATAVNEVIAHGIGDQAEVSRRAIEAGLDMDMGSNAYVQNLVELVKQGKVKEADIDKACRNILNAKYKLGLFDNPYKYCQEGREEKECYTPDKHQFARQIAQECQVLLKNENNVLPLRKDMKIAVVGPFADNAADMLGAWAATRRDLSNDAVSIYKGVTNALKGGSAVTAEGSWLMNDSVQEDAVKYGLYRIFVPNMPMPNVHATPQAELIAKAVEAANESDVIVACVGEANNMNGEGASRADISLPDAQEDMLKALKATGKPLIVVLTTGRPLILNWEEENADAILCTWSLGAEAGNAIADVLFGDANPSAKLTTSFPRAVGQLPLYYNHKNTGRPHPDDAGYRKFTSCYEDVVNGPLYPFGYGLSYTTFSYGDIKLSSAEMPMNGTVNVSVEVSNTGSRDGDEVVQLYIHDVYSSSTRPVKELRKFQKVHFKAGETKTVVFSLSAEDLKYYNHELEYVCEPGDFEIFVGPNSRDAKKSMLKVTDI